MKKISLILIVAVVSISMVATFSLIGCKEEPIEEVVEEVEEAVEEDMDEIDPWIVDVREGYMKYVGDIPPVFKGPNGQNVTWSKDTLVLTKSEVKEIQEGNYKVAIAWHVQSGDYIAAWRQGIIDTCEYLNLEIVAETDANYDPGKQKSDVETIIALDPDVLISIPIEPVTSAEAYRPALDAGILLSLGSNQPEGYVKGEDYIGITTANCHDRGLVAADLVGELIGEDSKIGLVTWGVEYWFTNYSDNLVRDTIEEKFSDITVLADEQFVDWEEAGNVAAGIIQRYPEVEGFYTTYVSSALPIASACVDANRPDIKIITNDIDEPTLVNMVEGGNIVGSGEDMTYNIGVDIVIQAAYGILGKEGPEYAVGPIMPVYIDNAREAWELTKHIPVPDGLGEALEKAGL
ncbi:MAG: substrate-binding domain-containing protein [Actinobacteria bacterium]|nr:substrate-binding domain-containing protein [Actinomycetota bacterium]